MRFSNHRLFLACTLSIAALGFTSAYAQSLPPVQTSGAVEYMSGGISEEESMAIKAESTRWPLMMEFAIQSSPRAEYASGVDVEIRDAKGRVALQAKEQGPFLLAKLNPGQYTVSASLKGKNLSKKVSVVKGKTAKAMFLWPAGTD